MAESYTDAASYGGAARLSMPVTMRLRLRWGLSTDQRGRRILTGFPGRASDIGAVEVIEESTESPVTFNDSNLEPGLIRDEIGDGSGGSYTGDLTPPSVLATITSLDATNQNVSDLTGLEYCTGLTNLVLNDNQISDISALQGLTGSDVPEHKQQFNY